MTEPTGTYAPVIRTQADLEAAWRHLIHPLGFHDCSLRLMMIQPDGRPLPQLIHLDDYDVAPTRLGADRFAAFLAELSDPVLDRGSAQRWAVLRCRPGAEEIDEVDRAWATMLREACESAGVRLEPLHVASDEAIRPVPLDERRARLRRVS